MAFVMTYALGALVAAAALAGEWAVGVGPFRLQALASYTMLGGLASGGSRLLAGRVHRRAGQVSAIVAAVLFAGIDVLYAVNVKLLAGEHFLSLKSLLADASIVLVLLLATAAVLRLRYWQSWDPLRAARPIATLLPAVVVMTATPLLFVFTWPERGASPTREGQGPNLLLLVLDSARRDHTSLHGYSVPTSPDLDALAPRGRVYDRAFSGAGWTVPSMKALLFSTVDEHGGASLASLLAERGYVTACFTENPHLQRDSVLVRGYDIALSGRPLVFDPFRRTIVGYVLDRLVPSDDRRLVDAALDWAAGVRGPYFLYVQLMDSHTPYRYRRLSGRRRSGRKIEFPTRRMKVTPDEAEDIVARYDAGIRRAQAEAARIIVAAEGSGRPFLAVTTADHGESLGEGGRWFHGDPPRPELLSVPMLVVGEGVVPGRVAEPVGVAAVQRTLLEAGGVRCSRCPGSDLRRSATGDPPQTLFAPFQAGPDTESLEELRALGYLGR